MKIFFLFFVSLCFVSLSGCNKTCVDSLEAGDDLVCALESGSEHRHFIIHVPKTYESNRASALVLDLHGTGGNSLQQKYTSGWLGLSEREGVVVVYPEALIAKGIRTQWNAGDCCELGQSANDELYLRKVIETVQQVVTIDPERIYVTGLSSGGAMSHYMGCVASDIVKGIAPISFQLSSDLSCNPVQSVGVIEFHAPTDTRRNFLGFDLQHEDGSVVHFPSALDSASRWAEINGCSMETNEVFQKGNSVGVNFPHCEDTKVQFYSVDGEGTLLGGHILYLNNDKLALADISWAFFAGLLP